MRWIVEVSPIGSKESQSYCVDADSWQKGLQAARKIRGDNAPMSGFSIELMNDGCRAVDPASRLRYEVKRTGDDTPLTPGGEAPPSSSRKSTRPPRATTKKGKSEAPPAVNAIPPIFIKREQDPTAETPLTYREYAFGVAKGSTGLKDWLNVAIFDLHKKGKVGELWKKWFGIDMLYPTGVGPGF